MSLKLIADIPILPKNEKSLTFLVFLENSKIKNQITPS